MTRYITKPTNRTKTQKPPEEFVKGEKGNTRGFEGKTEEIGRIVYCSLDEANRIINECRENVRVRRASGETDSSVEDFFRDAIFNAAQLDNNPGGIVIYEDGTEKDREGRPKIKRSYALVERIEEK